MSDVITLSLYSILKKRPESEGGGYTRYEPVLNESSNISRILKFSGEAATSNSQAPPRVVLRFCLISEDELSSDYIGECHEFFSSGFTSRLRSDGLSEDDLRRFTYTPFIPNKGNEQLFMKNLKSVGSYIDINKMRFIIENEGSKHLQMDTNTFIPCWNELYKNTFLQDKDSYGGSRCSLYYIAVHNKMVYVSTGSKLPGQLNAVLNGFYDTEHGNETLKAKDRNAIYDYVWGDCCHRMGYSHKLTVSDKAVGEVELNVLRDPTKHFSFYPAAMRAEVFTLNPYYLQAQHQQWNPNKTECDQIPADFAVDFSEYEGSLSIDEGFSIDKAVMETIFTTYSNIPLIHEYVTFDEGGLLYENAGYEDFQIFLNLQNSMIDQYFISKIIDGAIKEEGSLATPPPPRRGASSRRLTLRLDSLKAEVKGVAPNFTDIALDNFCKVKIYIGYSIHPSIKLKCSTSFELSKIRMLEDDDEGQEESESADLVRTLTASGQGVAQEDLAGPTAAETPQASLGGRRADIKSNKKRYKSKTRQKSRKKKRKSRKKKRKHTKRRI